MDLFKTVQDSITPEEDPAAQERLDAQSRETLQHIANNSSRAFFWKEVAQYSLTTMAIFGGMAIGGGAALMSGGTALLLAGGAGLVGLVSSVVGHRIELKNEISLEELYAKRTGQSVAESLDQLTHQGKAKQKTAQMSAPATALPPMPYQENLHASRRFQLREEAADAPALPSTRISMEQALGEPIQLPSEKTIH